MPHGAVCAIAADDEGRAERAGFALVVHRHTHTVVLLLCRNECRVVRNAAALTPQRFDEELLGGAFPFFRLGFQQSKG